MSPGVIPRRGADARKPGDDTSGARADGASAVVAASVAHPAPLRALIQAGTPLSNHALARRIAPRGVVLARDPPQASAPGPVAGEPEPVLQSADGAVDGRPVSMVGADLHERNGRHRTVVDSFKRSVDRFKDSEENWYRELDLVGEFIDLFNAQPRTDPGRWDAVKTEWDAVGAELDATIAISVSPETINRLGSDSEWALHHFDQTYWLDQEYSGAFSDYLHGFTQSAQTVHTVSVVVRDISFAAAVGIAVVLAAPVVFTAAAGTAGTLGLTGTSATVFATGTTALTMGGMGAGIEGTGQAVGALIVEGGGLLHDLVAEGRSWDEAVDAFDWELVGAQGWEGMKRGFVDGVLAYAGLGLERALASGTSVALTRVLGAEGAGALSMMLRRALQRAIASGATGGIIGALDAGVKSAMEGKSLAEIASAMEMGFAIGAAAGAVLGAGGGVLEVRARERLAQQIRELPELLARDPEAFAVRYRELVESLTPAQRAAWETEMAGRRFVDQSHYGPAREAFESGASGMPPAHRYGEGNYRNWEEAAGMLDAHAVSGQPLTRAEVEAAHAAAARDLTEHAGAVRTPEIQGRSTLTAGGGVGMGGMWTALTPEQIAILERNPHIALEMRRMVDAALTPEQVAARLETAVITYPEPATVGGKLDDFFAWYESARRTLDPSALAAQAQREFVSIHPFMDGNGRISRLVMDHALQSRGLPPALLENPNLDYMIAEAAWVGQVRRGVVESYETTARHADLFNRLVRSGEISHAATVWGSILGLTGNEDELIAWLYPEAGVCE